MFKLCVYSLGAFILETFIHGTSTFDIDPNACDYSLQPFNDFLTFDNKLFLLNFNIRLFNSIIRIFKYFCTN